ncbi:TonB-dependent receptor [Hymenobacter metallilatus]|uniref:TonB-dependent receptor n=1 Tax=Hymenobacter metallilatus TaxID=2493666 RepID=A0A428JDE0_9BACT|nr:TonB-dependent receptor [Hymenobacter metallilatus]RSK30254.1 TonB-dependent receptor [Hymenobacter metallilatus]
MKHLFTVVLLLLLLGAGGPAHAQEAAQQPITLQVQQVPFEEFARAVEAQTRFRFYFNPAAVDSVTITVQAEQKPLRAVLEQALRNTPLRFAVDAHNRVFVTRGVTITPELADSFFQPEQRNALLPQPDPNDQDPGSTRIRSVSAAASKLYEIGTSSATGKATLSGRIREAKTGEPVVGATVYIESPSIGTSTDQFGSYTLTLPVGRHDVKIRGIGIKNTHRLVQLRGDGRLDLETEDDVTTLREVVIEAEKDRNVASLQMGVEKLDIKTMRQVPTAFGETDILRVVLTLPGVKSVGEGNTGLNVRGGATDQNLILFNDATIYNPSHLFGFFSAFNPDVIKSVELYKSAIPAKYGGRLSSVLDITTREGNKKKLSGAGGIGPLTSRLTLEGPILKDKSSFIIGARSSYSDWILHLLPNESFKQSSASFNDISAHLSHEFNDKNTVYATGYLSTDRFRLASDTTYRYLNRNASVKWRHTINNKLYGVLTGATSHYEYDITSQRDAATASQLTYNIKQYQAQLDFTYAPNSKHTIDFGGSSVLYHVSPGGLRPSGSESLITPDVLAREQGLESALYFSDRIDVSPRLSVSVGLRYSLYNALGPREVYNYAPGLAKTLNTIVDTSYFAAGKVLATYHGPEYRLSARYSLTHNSSVKLSFNRTRQYIHMLSNTTAMSPTDIWKLSDSNIRPQVGDQYSLGYYRNFRANTIEASVETYYKSTKDFVDYKGGATLILNHHIETDIVNAVGKAYGVEVMLRKLTGKINGWVSYTYSRSLVQVNQGTTSEMINGGRYYPSNFDKPHDFTLIGNYRFSRRISASLNYTYSTGRPITLPLAKYYISNATRVYYSERNAYRVPDYYRADLALNLEGNHKVKKPFHSSWTFGVYNLTGRKNPYSVYFKSVGGQIRGYQLSIFGQPIPTITYNFKF